MMGHEIQEQLVLLPFVPYSVSLSLSVAYRDMRRSKIQMHRARARDILEANCRVLENLGEVFWSAEAMAEMGKKTLKELDRVYWNATDPESVRKQDKSNIADEGRCTVYSIQFSQNPRTLYRTSLLMTPTPDCFSRDHARICQQF
jgi:hypothetical protein